MHLFNNIFCTVFSLLCGFLSLDISLGLRDVRVQIPHAVRKGEKAILKCLYDLEGDSLYSVKWYKGRREFYSFTPKENPAMKVFQFAGVKVDRSSSNESQLVLEAANAATSGKYSCEVSADAPSFHTLISAGELEVVVVPGKDPVISGIRSRYKVGDIVRGNCSSSHSRPAANITWTVNGYETNPAHIRHFKPHKDPRELETVISAIHFVVTPQHFTYGKLKIRCTAFIHDVYWKSSEKSIEENRLNKAGTSNVVHKFSEDYFDLEEDNVIDRSDTYMTHIKGDVSSLNANGCATLYKCACFGPRLITLSFVLYVVQQMFQLLQQFVSQATDKAKQNAVNCQTFATKTSAAIKGEGTNLFKTNTPIVVIKQTPAQLHMKVTATTTVVSRICYDNKSMDDYWPKEKHKLQIVKEQQWETLLKYTNTSLHKPIHTREQLQWQWHMQSHLQLDCVKALHKCECNLTLAATRVTNISLAKVFLTILQYNHIKLYNKLYKFYAQFHTTHSNILSNNLHAAICLNYRTTAKSILQHLLFTAKKPTT